MDVVVLQELPTGVKVTRGRLTALDTLDELVDKEVLKVIKFLTVTHGFLFCYWMLRGLRT